MSEWSEWKGLSKEELLKKARVWARIAEKLHKFYAGKIMTLPCCAIDLFQDFAWTYTPGVAEPCRVIHKDIGKVFEYTRKWNYCAVVSDGSRILGLGNIGPEAGLPVMEGKALLFKALGGVDAFPLCVRAHTVDEMITFLKWIEPTFGFINLEDIAKPKCFEILEKARQQLEIPVWHDDQQGTATVVYAALKNALKVVGKKLSEVRITLIGFGSANKKVADVLLLAGAKPEHIIICDSHGILGPHREDCKGTYKWWWCLHTNPEGRQGGIPEAMKDADVLISMSRPGPGVIKPEWFKLMNDDSIAFLCANPIPEAWPWEAIESGKVKVVGTGRSDFPNQVNNSLGFPAIARGVLDVWARTVTDKMCVAAGDAIAKFTEISGEIHEGRVICRMSEWEVYPYEAACCAMQAIREGVARRKVLFQEELERAYEVIRESLQMIWVLMKEGLIKAKPEDVLGMYPKKEKIDIREQFKNALKQLQP